MKRYFLLLFLAIALQVNASGLYQVPQVIGDPAKFKFSIVEFQQIRDGFHYPSPTFQRLISQYYDLSSSSFQNLPLDSQIRIVLKICDTLGIAKDNRFPFLMMHYSYHIPKQTLEKMLAIYCCSS